jgi:hypothetical protein
LLKSISEINFENDLALLSSKWTLRKEIKLFSSIDRTIQIWNKTTVCLNNVFLTLIYLIDLSRLTSQKVLGIQILETFKWLQILYAKTKTKYLSSTPSTQKDIFSTRHNNIIVFVVRQHHLPNELSRLIQHYIFMSNSLEANERFRYRTHNI